VGFFSTVTWSPWIHSTNENGPVPTGMRAESPASIAFLLTIQPSLITLMRNGPNEYLRWKTTWVGLVTSTDSIESNSAADVAAVAGSRIRSKVYLTSSAVNFSPLWKVALSTRSKTQVVGSVCSHFVARTP
jgi:hypothetical protein